MFTDQLEKVAPAVEDGVKRWLLAGDMPFLHESSNNKVAGKAGFWIIQSELLCT